MTSEEGVGDGRVGWLGGPGWLGWPGWVGDGWVGAIAGCSGAMAMPVGVGRTVVGVIAGGAVGVGVMPAVGVR